MLDNLLFWFSADFFCSFLILSHLSQVVRTHLNLSCNYGWYTMVIQYAIRLNICLQQFYKKSQILPINQSDLKQCDWVPLRQI